jgi:hypothetical protein
MFPNMLRRAHKVTDATQSAELTKAVLTHQAMFLSYPDQFDLLTNGTTTSSPDYLPGSLTASHIDPHGIGCGARRIGVSRGTRRFDAQRRDRQCADHGDERYAGATARRHPWDLQVRRRIGLFPTDRAPP